MSSELPQSGPARWLLVVGSALFIGFIAGVIYFVTGLIDIPHVVRVVGTIVATLLFFQILGGGSE